MSEAKHLRRRQPAGSRPRRRRAGRAVAVVLAIFSVAGAHAQTPSAAPTPDAAAVELSRLADGLYRRGLYRMAAAEYAKFIDHYPDHPSAAPARFFRAECFRLLGQDDEAVKVLTELRRHHPRHPLAARAAVTMASLFLDAARVDDALTLLRQTPPADIPADLREARLYYLGVAENRKQNTAAAAAAFQALAAEPLHSDHPLRGHARLALAYLKRNAGDTAAALTLLRQLTGSTAAPRAVQPEALFLLGDILFLTQRLAGAAAVFGQLLRQYPDSRYARQATLNRAWALFELQQYADVAELLNDSPAAIAPEPLYLLGLALKRLARHDEALVQFRRALTYEDNPYRAQILFAMVESLFETRAYDACVSQARDFLRQFPKEKYAADAAYFLGQSLLLQEQPAAAAAAYETALRLYWGEWPHRRLALQNLAAIYQQLKAYRKAADTYERLAAAAETDKDRVAARLNAGSNLILAEDLVPAFGEYRKVASGFPDRPEAAQALLKMGEIAVRQKSSEEAVALLTEFLQKHPKHPLTGRALYLRGSTLYQLNRLDEAVADLRRSVGAGPFAEKKLAELFLAYALWERGDHEPALKAFDALLAGGDVDDDFTPDILDRIGSTYIDTNNFKAAVACYRILSRQKAAGLRFLGRLGLGRVALARGDPGRAETIFAPLAEAAAPSSAARAQVLAYRGEALRRGGHEDQAIIAFEEALKLAATDVSSMALARLGLARIHAARGEDARALRSATAVFVLYDDPAYCPDAMLLALRLLVRAQRLAEAEVTYKELKARYPAALTEFRRKPENQDVFRHF